MVVRAWGVSVAVAAPSWALDGLGSLLSTDTLLEEVSASTPSAVVAMGPVDAEVVVAASQGGWEVRGISDEADAGGGGRVWRSGPDGAAVREAVARRLGSEVHLAIAARSPDTVFVHAGAVAWRGLGVVVPGRSMTGKSTLVRTLVQCGASYLSDEYAVLDDRGWVHPYVKPLSLRTQGGAVAVPADRFGPVAAGPVPVAAVVSTSYRASAVWSPEVGAGAEVVLALVDNAVAARVSPERVLRHASAVARHGVAWFRGERGDAIAAANAILAAVDALAGQETPPAPPSRGNR